MISATRSENGYLATRRTSLGSGLHTLGVDSEDDLYIVSGQGSVLKVNDLGETLSTHL